MILSDKDILNLCQSSPALISNFKDSNLNSASYDVSMSNTVYRFKSGFRDVRIDVQESIDDIYLQIHIPESGYVVGPHEYLLVELDEIISLPRDVVAHIRPRTRFTRLGLIVSSQHCNPTYNGRLKLGLLNATPYAITIFEKMKIAQIVFERLESSPSDSRLYKNDPKSRYQEEDGFIGAKFDDEVVRKAEVKYNEIINKMSKK